MVRQQLFTFDQLSVLAAAIISPASLAGRGGPMEDFTELMQRLLEIHGGGRQRNWDLIAEDDRLMDGLQKRNLARK